jgi:hypothetical protein
LIQLAQLPNIKEIIMLDPEANAAEPTENQGGGGAMADAPVDEADAAMAEPTENDGGTKAQ